MKRATARRFSAVLCRLDLGSGRDLAGRWTALPVRIEAGELSSVKFRELESARMEALPDNAKAAVNDRFQQLVASNTEISQIIVVWQTIGEPPGTVVAVESVQAWPWEIRERQGRPDRQLTWLVDPVSTGLH